MSTTEIRHIGALLLAAFIAVVAVATGCDDDQSGSGKGGGGAAGQSLGGHAGQAGTAGGGGLGGTVGGAGGGGHGGGGAGGAAAAGSSGSGGTAGAAGAGTGGPAGAGGTAGAGGHGPGGSVSAGGSAGAGGGGVPSGTGGRQMNPTCEGDGTSGRLLSICGYYCSSVTAYCTGANKQYPFFEDCTSQCYAPAWLCGTEGDMTGNTVYCRLWHAKRAINAPDTECAAAGPNSTVCN